jgi:hypothetical protein
MKRDKNMNKIFSIIINELESILRREVMENNCLNFEELVDKKCYKIIKLLKKLLNEYSNK